MRKVFIHTSVPFLKKWLAIHPRKNERDAPLFVRITAGKGHAMSYGGLKGILKKAVEKAGVKKKYNPHLFRHSRATFLAGYLTEAQLCYVMGWIQGSDMASTYVHLSGRDVNNALRRVYGLGEEKKQEEKKFIPKKCEVCGEINEPKTGLCWNCSNPLTYKAALKRFQAKEKGSFDETLKELFWEKYKSVFLNQINPVDARRLVEEAERKTRE